MRNRLLQGWYRLWRWLHAQCHRRLPELAGEGLGEDRPFFRLPPGIARREE